MKSRNITFALVISCILSSPAVLWVFEHVDSIDIPSWLSIEDATYLSGGRTDANISAVASLGGFFESDLQKALEDEIGNYIPAKATALLTNAQLQRSAIAASNILFQWDCYPTFYGSNLAVVPSEGRLVELAQTTTKGLVKSIQDTAERLSAFSLSHPDVNLYVYLGPDSQNVSGSPTGSLMASPLSYNDIESMMMKKEEESAFHWISGAVTYDEFLQNWYKTDHHWNIQGAFQAYQRIATALGFGDDLLNPSAEIVYEDPIFFGSFARRGLDEEHSDKITDYTFDNSQAFTVEISGQKATDQSLAHAHDYAEGQWDINPYANRYAEYYHTDYPLIKITNNSEDAKGELLIVGDSYSNSMERFLAAHYKTTYVIDPRHTPETLDDFLSTHKGIDDVVFIMRSTNLFSKAMLNFLEEPA